MAETHFKIEKIEKLPGSEAQILGEISLSFLNECKKDALKHLKSHINLPGFRPGQVPDDILIKTLGEMGLLEETAEVAMAKEYRNIVLESKLKPITRPEVRIIKLAPGIPLTFQMTLALEPEFDLPDYKRIAKSIASEPKEKVEKAEDKKGETDKEKGVDNNQLKIMEALVKETKIDFPKRFLDMESTHMIEHFKQDLEKAGLKWEEYIKKVGKTEYEISESFKEQIIYRAKTELIISKIAEKEGLKTYGEVFDFLVKKD